MFANAARQFGRAGARHGAAHGSRAGVALPRAYQRSMALSRSMQYAPPTYVHSVQLMQSTQFRRDFAGNPMERSLSTKLRSFSDEAFTFFDLNGDGVIVWSEIEKAYIEKSAGAQMARMFAAKGLQLDGIGITWEVLEDMDLIRAYQEGEVAVVDNKISKPEFVRWCDKVVAKYNDRAGESTAEGAQDMHE